MLNIFKTGFPFVIICIIIGLIIYREKEKEAKDNNYMAEGISIGILLGLLISIIFKLNIGIGVSFGLILGLLIGILVKR